ncbi:hypothetical protein [Dysgonomonas sp. 25]|uniref:hypothetical protein n=1 Tax=Dysgonomonas sp. 25 TaxID=2302933 RepID=UPI0013D8231B|nr:hypothetical protein [Dysgonomonas sp. 25]NDV68607.1 hypothetical protein [Dysgonomonas sp. 25]
MKLIKIRQGKDNLPFKSQAEADRYSYLSDMQEKGMISDLKRNITFTLIEPVYKKKIVKKRLKTKIKTETKKICVKAGVTLTVDIMYWNRKGKRIIEMIKQPKDYKDPVYILKKKLLYYLHRIDIIEN